mgnify:CR=1 FL=1
MSGFSAVDLRRMLSRLRDVMAGAGTVQERVAHPPIMGAGQLAEKHKRQCDYQGDPAPFGKLGGNGDAQNDSGQ